MLSGQQRASGQQAINTDITAQPRFVDTDGGLYILRAGLNRVGREMADVLLVHKTVSRNHAVVVYDEDRVIFSVEDSGSSNGTRVNGQVLPPRSSNPLHPGDEVQFGSVTLHLLAGEQMPRPDKTLLQGEPEDEEGEPTVPPVPTKPIGRLTLVRGRGPQETLLGLGTLTIGRVIDNDLSLPHDRYASGHHAHIVVEDALFRLIDLGSTNGTFLNDLRLTTNESIAMNDGDIIKVGSTMFQFAKINEQETHPAQDPVADPATVETPIEELPLTDPV
jgi:pSer/pThr/pTyr-binding forkhead associated (FHA) protein